MKVCTFRKETENKYRWDYMEGNAPLEIYIPKWRVPALYPQRIFVKIFEPDDSHCPIITLHSKKEVKVNPRLRLVPITAEVTYKEDMTLTARYDPILEGNDAREVGSPYIPFVLLGGLRPKLLVIEINWET